MSQASNSVRHKAFRRSVQHSTTENLLKPSMPMDDYEVPAMANGLVRIKIDINKEKAKEVWDKIWPHYRGQLNPKAVNILNQYVRELIFRDCGVDIGRFSGRTRFDPLTDKQIVIDLFIQNPHRFTEKQKFQLEMRAAGFSVKQIHLACKERAEKGDWNGRGFCIANICSFFNRVRRALGFEYQPVPHRNDPKAKLK